MKIGTFRAHLSSFSDAFGTISFIDMSRNCTKLKKPKVGIKRDKNKSLRKLAQRENHAAPNFACLLLKKLQQQLLDLDPPYYNKNAGCWTHPSFLLFLFTFSLA
jgi:hypothetical protein